MNRPVLKLCVLTISLLSSIALGARSAAAGPPKHQRLVDIFGVSVYADGSVKTDRDSGSSRAISLLPRAAAGAATRAAAGATTSQPARTLPPFAVLSFFGETMCVGELPRPLSWACDITVPAGGSHAAK